jgi:hypothetical protein
VQRPDLGQERGRQHRGERRGQDRRGGGGERAGERQFQWHAGDGLVNEDPGGSAGRVKLVKVNVDLSPQVSRRFNAQAIPTLLRLYRPPPGAGGVEFERRCQPSRQRAQRPGLDLLSPAPFLAFGQDGECGEEH